MSNKAPDKRVINKTAKKVGLENGRNKKEVGLKDQYFVIRDDILKLRDDLAKGYDMTKDWIDKKGSVRSILMMKAK